MRPCTSGSSLCFAAEQPSLDVERVTALRTVLLQLLVGQKPSRAAKVMKLITLLYCHLQTYLDGYSFTMFIELCFLTSHEELPVDLKMVEWLER